MIKKKKYGTAPELKQISRAEISGTASRAWLSRPAQCGMSSGTRSVCVVLFALLQLPRGRRRQQVTRQCGSHMWVFLYGRRKGPKRTRKLRTTVRQLSEPWLWRGAPPDPPRLGNTFRPPTWVRVLLVAVRSTGPHEGFIKGVRAHCLLARKRSRMRTMNAAVIMGHARDETASEHTVFLTLYSVKS